MKSNGGKDCAKTLTMFLLQFYSAVDISSTIFQISEYELPDDLDTFMPLLLTYFFIKN